MTYTNKRYYNYEFVFIDAGRHRVNVEIYRKTARDSASLVTLYGYLTKKEAYEYAKQYVIEEKLAIFRGTRLMNTPLKDNWPAIKA